MAENDTHYNGMPGVIYNQNRMENNENREEPVVQGPGPVIPLPSPGEGTPALPGTGNGMESSPGDGNIPSTPLPSPGEGGPTFPGSNDGNGNVPVTPLPSPGEGGPAFPGGNDGNGGNVPVIPLPSPGEGGPAFPGNNNGGIPGRPGFPTLPGFPVFPGAPGLPESPNFPVIPDLPLDVFGQVRFLNASANPFPVNISIDGNPYAINSRFGTISNYDWVSDGFHTVAVRRATGMRSVLLQQNFPFVAGQKVTMVLTDTASGGLELVRIVDTGCANMPFNSGCYRFANMTFSGSRFDLLLAGGETVFRNVRFQNVTSYKQAVAGTYQFFVSSSNTYTFLRELPIIVIGAVGTIPGTGQPLVSFQADISAGQNYTSYLIGNTWSDLGLRVITVED